MAGAGLLVVVFTAAAGTTASDAACARWRSAFTDMPTRNVVVDAAGRRLVWPVKVADTRERRAAGFQCATAEEIDRTRILFDFGTEVLTRFHMRNVPAPLEIGFAKGDGRIFAILRMDPSPTALYGPLEPFRYALEARLDFFGSEGIRAGNAQLIPNQ